MPEPAEPTSLTIQPTRIGGSSRSLRLEIAVGSSLVLALLGLAVFGGHRGLSGGAGVEPKGGDLPASSSIAAAVNQRLPTPGELDRRHDRFTIDDARVDVRPSVGRRLLLR